MAAWVPITDEAIVDFGLGTPEQQQAAAARLHARELETRARWAALPMRVRLTRRLRARTYEPRRRIAHAWAALRGVECEP